VYKTFSISGSEDKYRLNVAQYNGTIGNSIFGLPNRYHNEHNMKFYTPDQDNDNYAGGKCLTVSGWWKNVCGKADRHRKSSPLWDLWVHGKKDVIFSERKIR